MTQHTYTLLLVVMKPHFFDDFVIVAVCFICLPPPPRGRQGLAPTMCDPLAPLRECNSTRLLAVEHEESHTPQHLTTEPVKMARCVTQAKSVPSGFSKSHQGEAPQGFLDDAVEFEKSSSALCVLSHLERGPRCQN